jgi:hypothetical protein
MRETQRGHRWSSVESDNDVRLGARHSNKVLNSTSFHNFVDLQTCARGSCAALEDECERPRSCDLSADGLRERERLWHCTTLTTSVNGSCSHYSPQFPFFASPLRPSISSLPLCATPLLLPTPSRRRVGLARRPRQRLQPTFPGLHRTGHPHPSACPVVGSVCRSDIRLHESRRDSVERPQH